MLEFMLGMVIVLAALSVFIGKNKKIAALVLLLSLTGLTWSLYQGDRQTVTEEGAHQYFVAQIEDLSNGNIKRFHWHVIVTAPLNGESLRNLAEAVIEEACMGEGFNALTVAFYDYPEYIGFGAPLGRVVFAPGGNMNDAGEVHTGDYGRMQTKYNLRHKDWTLQLTPREVAVWCEWNDLYYQYLSTEEDPDDDKITAKVSQLYDLPPGEVNSILARQVTWVYDNSGE